MGDPNILSNGTCYWAQGQKMDPGFIPCGNDLYGHKHCCWAGDYCLVDNACFGNHGGTGDGTALTYLAGCSDPEYADSSCPNKNPYQNQPWAGLVNCKDSNVWVACSQSGGPATPARGDSCTCTDANAATAAFTDSTVLSPQGSLPITQGGTISFKGGMVPPITTTLTLPGPTTSDSSSTSASTGTGSTESSGNSASTGSGSGSGSGGATVTVTSLQSPGGSNPTAAAAGGSEGGGGGGGGGSELSIGAKAGIGAGAGVAGLALLAALILFLMRSTRRSRQSWSAHNQQTEPYGDPQQGHHYAVTKLEGDGSHGSNRVSAMTGISATGTPATGTTISEMESRAARPWSLRSELDTTGPAARMVGTTSPPMGMYAADGQQAQPQHYVAGPAGYGNAPGNGMQHAQNWVQPYPTNTHNQMGQVGVAMSPEVQQSPGHGGGLAPVHELA